MADYAVSGAGDAAWDGTVVETGTANGLPAYELDPGHWSFWDGSQWSMDTSTGGGGSGAYYYSLAGGPTLPTAGWTANVGAGPAPTVTLIGGAPHAGDMFLGE